VDVPCRNSGQELTTYNFSQHLVAKVRHPGPLPIVVPRRCPVLRAHTLHRRLFRNAMAPARQARRSCLSCHSAAGASRLVGSSLCKHQVPACWRVAAARHDLHTCQDIPGDLSLRGNRRLQMRDLANSLMLDDWRNVKLYGKKPSKPAPETGSVRSRLLVWIGIDGVACDASATVPRGARMFRNAVLRRHHRAADGVRSPTRRAAHRSTLSPESDLSGLRAQS
jgi:hypothetical protein